MAILGAAPEAFAAYDRAIAEEYRAVPRWLYRRRRRAFLRGLLEAPRIYLSDVFHARLDAQARRNLADALAAPSGR
jgi:predicted metal-dependent HD superfamily phosphohydrolase